MLGIALSCRQGKDLYYDHLLENLTFSPFTIKSVYELLNHKGLGPRVKSLLCLPYDWNFDDQFHHLIEVELSGSKYGHGKHASDAERNQYQKYSYERAVTWLSDCIYQKLENLETLIIESPILGFHFLTKFEDGRRPRKFLANSLKKLYFPLSKRQQFSITAKSALFLLCYCNSLEQAALGFDVEGEDFNYLTEYSETFKRLSNVKDLAIGLKFVYREKDQSIWWGSPNELSQTFLGGTKKTEVIYHFLLVTNQIRALEVKEIDMGKSAEDETFLQAGFLKALSTSTSSLKQFRCLIFSARTLGSNLLPFKNLTHLTLHPNSVVTLLRSAQMLPSNLSVISMVCYQSYLFSDLETRWLEDEFLLKLLKAQVTGDFTEVVIPEVPIDWAGKEVEVDREVWLRQRQSLEDSEIFKSGKFSLTRYRPGDIGE